MISAWELPFGDGHTDFPVALIGLGRRGCESIQRLRQAGLAEVHAILIDHDPESRQEDNNAHNCDWIGNVATVPDFSTCAALGLVVVGAEHHDKTEQLSFKLGLLRERPTLLLGIILPPPAGDRIRLSAELLSNLDSLMCWPRDPSQADAWALLQATVADWVATLSAPGPVEADFAGLITTFNNARPMLVASATEEYPASPERVQAVAYTALAAWYDQGFKPAQAAGMLAVVRGVDDAMVETCDAVSRLFRDILPESAPVMVAAPAGAGWQQRTRVSLFAVGAFGGSETDWWSPITRWKS